MTSRTSQRWHSSPSRDLDPITSAQRQSSATTSVPMAAAPQAPRHPLPQMQGAFEESMRETMSEATADGDHNPYLGADKFKRRKLLLESKKYERTVAGRWLQKQGENFHPLWKLVAQISFGMHLLQKNMARSDADVIHILQTHVDEIDAFLERTTEDFDLAQEDVNDRIKHLRTPLEHGEVFDTMLVDREFRTAIVDGNEKIEHILSRTTVAMKDALKDVQKGLDGTKQLAAFLKDVDRKWPDRSEEHAAVFAAMMGNTEGWAEAYQSLQQKGSDLGLSLVQLEGIISEIQRRAGVASRRNLPVRQSISSPIEHVYGGNSIETYPTQLHATSTQTPPQDPRELRSQLKLVQDSPSTPPAAVSATRDSRALNLSLSDFQDHDSTQVSLSDPTMTVNIRHSGRSQLADTNMEGSRVLVATEEDAFPMQFSTGSIESEVQASDCEADSQDIHGTEQIVPQIGERTFFSNASSDAGSVDAQSSLSIEKSRSISHTKTASIVSSHDVRGTAGDDGIINHAHPLLQDIRVREASAMNVENEPSIESLDAASTSDSVSLVRRSHYNQSDPLSQRNNRSLDSPAITSSNRGSDNTIATPVSLGSDRDVLAVHARVSGGSEARPKAPLINTNVPATSQLMQKDSGSPPSPSLAELTSATVSGPEMGDPFAPASPTGRPRHQELIDRIATSINESNPLQDKQATAATHSRKLSRPKPEPVHASIVTTATNVKSDANGATITTTSGTTQVVTTTATTYAVGPPQLANLQTNARQDLAHRGSPSSPPLATQYRNLSPFPSTSSRGSRRVPAPALDRTIQGEPNHSRTSSFKKFFNVKRNSHKDTLGLS